MSPRNALLLSLMLSRVLAGQTQMGSVSGVVYDGQTGRPVPAVAISIDGQTSSRMVTDSDGRFAVPLSPGTYKLLFTAPNYLPVNLSDVVVKAGETTEASTVLSNKSQVTRVDVTASATAVGATAEAMLQERRLAGVVSDSIGREELAASTASDAAGALQKVTGVSLVGEGFVYVRGLGERYSATELNGSIVPTTEPEKRVVPLDLFPTHRQH